MIKLGCLVLGALGSLGAQGVFLERTIPTPNSQPHCVVSDSRARIWYAGIGSNRVGYYDPATDEFREIPVPTANSQPHGIAVSPGDVIWFTEQRGNKIGRVDPQTLAITEYPVPSAGAGPHTPIFDGRGAIWFTEQSGNRIGRLTIATGQIEEFLIPTPNSGPYGIVADAEGNAWFCSFGGGSDRIGRVDARTGEIREFRTPTPNSGPRRPWVDSKGRIWVALNRAHKLAVFDPATERFREYDTPSPSGEPYGVVVDRKDQVWYNEFRANTLVQFDPAAERFTVYPLPLANELIRIVAVDPEDRVWYGNNGGNRIGVLRPGQVVVNAASGSPVLAPGALMSIYGARLPAQPEVRVQERAATVLYASPTQINAHLPSETAPGPARVEVRGPSFLLTQALTLTEASPGLFVVVRNADFRLVSETNPVAAGDYMAIFATGLGKEPVPAEVTVGGAPAAVAYAGSAPGFVGLDQINARVPSGLNPGSHPVRVTVRGVASNEVRVWVR
jgi:virginiamycin B lyase